MDDMKPLPMDAWLDGKLKLAKAKQMPVSSVETLTPELATYLLERNKMNRPISQSKVKKIVEDIKSGRYQLNGESVIIDEDGNLNDGQHRCWAVVEAELPITTIMVYGVTRASRMTVDIGSARTAGDHLYMEGISHANIVASIARQYHMFLRKHYTRGVSAAITKPMLHAFYLEHKGVLDDAATAVANWPKQIRVAPASFGAAFAALLAHDKPSAQLFIEQLRSGYGLEAGNPIWLLREALVGMKANNAKSGIVVETVLRTYNAWRQKRHLKRVPRLKGEYPQLV